MSLRDDIKTLLSVSGSLSIVITESGHWQINVRSRDKASYHVHMAEDVFEGLGYSASKVTPEDVAPYDIFAAAKDRLRARRNDDLIGDAVDVIEAESRSKKSRDDDLI